MKQFSFTQENKMLIPNFPQLLSGVLKDKQQQLFQWRRYTLNEIYNLNIKHPQINSLIAEEITKVSKDDISLAGSSLQPYEIEREYGANIQEAIRFYEQALKQGDAAAMNTRAYMHVEGIGGPLNLQEAIRLFEQAIKLGNADAMNARACLYVLGIGGKPNFKEAIRFFEQAIELGDAAAMNNLACLYKLGIEGKSNLEEAIRLYDRAIALGSASAMNNRACMHENSEGGETDFAAAIRLYDQAIALGDVVAITNRAYMHIFGKGGEIDHSAAISLYEQGIKRGDPGAMIGRCNMHADGIGGEVNLSEAVSLYKQAVKIDYFQPWTSLEVIFPKEFFKIKHKAGILRSKGHEDAYQKAIEIHITLIEAYSTLLQDKNQQAFEDKCMAIIRDNRPILDKHRGWSELLLNLAIAIPTLGLGLLVKGAINVSQNKSFFFVHKTDTAKIIDEIQGSLKFSPKV